MLDDRLLRRDRLSRTPGEVNAIIRDGSSPMITFEWFNTIFF